jgi:hypothetical protein
VLHQALVPLLWVVWQLTQWLQTRIEVFDDEISP